MLIGRELKRKMRNREKFVMTTPLILGIDGRPMSKTAGNCVWLTDSAQQMYGKIMSIPDNLILDYFELLTDLPVETIKKLPSREAKARLAREIATIYHGKKEGILAEQEFSRVFKEKKFPSKIPEFKIREKSLNILDLLTKTKLAPSKSEAKRLVEQGGVRIDNEVQKDWRLEVKIKKGQVLQVGKRKFVKIV